MGQKINYKQTRTNYKSKLVPLMNGEKGFLKQTTGMKHEAEMESWTVKYTDCF